MQAPLCMHGGHGEETERVKVKEICSEIKRIRGTLAAFFSTITSVGASQMCCLPRHTSSTNLSMRAACHHRGQENERTNVEDC